MPAIASPAARNLEAVQAIYGAFATGDVPAILARLHPAVAWEQWEARSPQAAAVPWLAPRSGVEGAAAFFTLLGEALEMHALTVLDITVSDRQAAAEVVLDSTVRATGKRVLDEEMHLWTFDDAGRVTRFRHYADTARHIEAAATA
ncbi:MAG: nuclear transport factor 2 family protein [Dehalococcoidia bacterium]|nr:nuclear transport factor 2 family protein [Dehalococcoidia bacterium]